MSNLDEMIDNMFKSYIANENKRFVVAIDGRCGAGKTTLAEEIKNIFNATVVHMDDFFLPLSLRNKERLEEAGGNFHYERFEEEVVESIKSKEMLTYRIFSCEKMKFTDTVSVKPERLIIVEGSYSSHPRFKDFYDLKVFCDIDPITQQQRIIKRNGREQYENFKNKWIPMEEKYFKEFGIMEKSDYVVKMK